MSTNRRTHLSDRRTKSCHNVDWRFTKANSSSPGVQAKSTQGVYWHRMGKYDKLRQRIVSGASDANIDFDEICQLLREYGFEERVSGSHHIFRKKGVTERPNLQRDGSKAKVYQVRQVRQIIQDNNLGENAADEQDTGSEE